MSNAKIVSNYLDVVFNQKDVAKAETYWAGDMIQHNPGMPAERFGRIARFYPIAGCTSDEL